MARVVWEMAIALTVAIFVGGLVSDLLLWLMGRETVSAWLRLNPECFWWPAGAVLLVLVALAFHLFWAPWS